ncbi:hypothetical protein ACKLNO_01265 [Neisseriaceae bacterium B1]
MSNNQDLNVQIRRNPETQNYRVSLLTIKNGLPDKSEMHICQTLPEALEKIAAFEDKHLNQFENAIDYKKVSWREIARQNQAAQEQALKKPTSR